VAAVAETICDINHGLRSGESYRIRVDYPLFENEPLQGTEFAEKRTRGNQS